MKKKYIYIILFIISLIGLDQLSKYLIVINFQNNEHYEIINNFFELRYITNTGAAFGMFNGNTFILGIISLFLVFYIIREIKLNIKNKLELYSLLLILSGALGNLIDRFFRGYVVDFISFKIFNKQMPIFNIADIFITIGVFMLIICVIRSDANENNNKRKRGK
ncbi:MAG: signal peptidase II [Bacilli bacterium]|nr:signal peptidase II [Bacilli bacterium]